MRGFDWRLLFRSEKGRLKPTMVQDIKEDALAVGSLDRDLEAIQDTLSLRLLKGVVVAAQISSATRDSVAEQVALLHNAGS